VARKLTALGIILIVVLAAAVRIWGIDWGLPTARHYFSYHPDETVTLLAAMKVNFFEGQLDPGFYNYGSLYIYLVSISVLLVSCLGLIDLSHEDIFSNIGEFAKLYLTGRVAAVLLGIATVYLVYLLGKRMCGRGVGLLAALFMAAMPIHVMHSRFLAVDVPATFLVVAALIFAFRIPEGHRLRDYLLSGLFAGLAAGTKYSAGLVILSPIVAHLATGKAGPFRRVLSGKLASVLIAAAAGFLIGTPGAVLYRHGFARDFLYEFWHAKMGHGFVFAGTGSGYVYHFTHSLWDGMGLPLLALAAIGILYAFCRRTTGDLILLVFVVAYYAVIGAAQVKFARYVIPLLPVLAILAARVSSDLIAGLLKRGLFAKALGYIAVLVLLLITGYTLFYSLALDRVFASTDTRDRAAAWVRNNVLPGSSIGLPTIPWFYTPPLDPYFGLVDSGDRRERVQELLDYALVVGTREWDAALLKRELPDYVILSEFEYEDRLRIRDKAAERYFRVLQRDYRLGGRFADAPSLFGLRVPALRELPHDMSYASPTILIYARKGIG